jgi:hypothetical protein
MNNRCAVVLFCCLACLQAQVQAQVCQPSGNLIRSVWVNSDGAPVIEWDAPSSLPNYATGYIIYEYVGGSFCTDSIGFVDLNAPRSYTDTRSDIQPLAGSRAYSIAINKSSEDKEAITEHHAFSWLSAEYDSCNYAIDLRWTAYVGWERATYNIYGSVQGTSPELLATTGEVQYTLSDVPDNVEYEVYVEAVNAAAPSVKSASNRLRLFTKTSQRPSPAGLSINGLRFAGHAVELQFAVDPATRLPTFHITRSAQLNGTYTPVHTFSDKTLRSYTDNDVHAVYYYRLAAENNCRLIAAQGNVLNNIDLRLVAENGAWYLSWNKLFNGLFYSLARLEPSPQQLLSYSADSTYIDRIDSSNAALDYCYQIESSTDIGGKSVAIACAAYEPEVLMPDALNPESMATNPQTGRQRNQFGPVLFIASTLYSYQLEIYDHNGGKIAAIEKTAADSPLEKSWTGLNSRGEFVPENMYLYRLELTFINGKTVVKTGNVAVLYD